MKKLNWISWLCIIIAGIIMLFGAIDFLFYGVTGGFLGVKHTTTFFQVANTFLLATICFILFSNRSEKNNK